MQVFRGEVKTELLAYLSSNQERSIFVKYKYLNQCRYVKLFSLNWTKLSLGGRGVPCPRVQWEPGSPCAWLLWHFLATLILSSPINLLFWDNYICNRSGKHNAGRRQIQATAFSFLVSFFLFWRLSGSQVYWYMWSWSQDIDICTGVKKIS